jgi:UDP-glucose 4-epimerase
MRVLVAGGAGYIGSVVTAALLAGGHEVTVLDDLSTGHADAVPAGATFVQASLHDSAPVLADVRPEAVLHFAAKSLVGESQVAPEIYWDTNVCGTLALLEAMRAADCRRIVFSSTAATYGEPEQVPIREDAVTRPTNTYGATKLAVDLAIGNYTAASGGALGAVSLRYFNVAGAHGTDRSNGGATAALGERHTVETHLIPLVLQVALGQRDEIAIYGHDWPTPDGTCVRDYIHVDDLAEAHVLALDLLARGDAGSVREADGHLVCNLGNGQGFSVLEVIEACRRVTGHAIPARVAPRRTGDPGVLVASSARARAELGWKPTHTDLDGIVADAWAFARARA